MSRNRKIRTATRGSISPPRSWLFTAVATLVAAIAVFSGCTPNQRIIESSRTPQPLPAMPTPESSVESDIQAMQTADFTYILVFRRKDNGVMNSEDKSFINANTPPEVNRKTLSDGGRAVVVGSNFPFLPGTIENLTDRFMMEDHSKPDAGPIEEDRGDNTNLAANGNKVRRSDGGRRETIATNR